MLIININFYKGSIFNNIKYYSHNFVPWKGKKKNEI